MKRISIILMAFALTMTMSQCKKNSEQLTANDEIVTITLDVNNNDGSKVVVNTATGTVDFESGDKIYVGSGGKYVGFLTHNGTNFSGNITNPTENQPLQFYFLGNVTPSETLSAGTTEECSVVISNQTEHLPVISCAASNENYVSGVTAYSAHLLNKCALVKFSVTTPSNAAICITGMKNKVTLDFANNTLTPSQDGEGVIMLPAGSGENVEKWAILLPQEALEEGEEGSAYSEDGVYTGTRPEISIIVENGYLAQGISIEVSNTVASDIPIGAINGLFTINANGDQVYFSKGNLQYIGSTAIPYWKFADNQWDYFGDNEQFSISQNVDRDLFGWGTSGYNHGSIFFQPWCTSQDNSGYYAYGLSSYNLYDQTGQADWGYNAIINGGNYENNGWRTLTSDEWYYVFHNRITESDIRYAKAKVSNVNGVILLPDNWSQVTYYLNNVNSRTASYNSNIISVSNWGIMESTGAVFLPSSGIRVGASLIDGGSYGAYWSSVCVNTNLVYCLDYSNSSGFYGGGYDRSAGLSVRLVKTYQNNKKK
jgi:hypothetical protein